VVEILLVEYFIITISLIHRRLMKAQRGLTRLNVSVVGRQRQPETRIMVEIEDPLPKDHA